MTDLRLKFKEMFSEEPEAFFSAAGRVNLIGGHVDTSSKIAVSDIKRYR